MNTTIGAYEDDRNGILENVKDVIFPLTIELADLGTVTINAGKRISNRDDHFGYKQYDRSVFWETNRVGNN